MFGVSLPVRYPRSTFLFLFVLFIVFLVVLIFLNCLSRGLKIFAGFKLLLFNHNKSKPLSSRSSPICNKKCKLLFGWCYLDVHGGVGSDIVCLVVMPLLMVFFFFQRVAAPRLKHFQFCSTSVPYVWQWPWRTVGGLLTQVVGTGITVTVLALFVGV